MSRIEVVRAEVLRTGERTAILRLTDSEGRIGLGEASPLPGRSIDDAAACARALESAAPRALPATAEAAAAEAASIDARLPAARFALETALLDLAAQVRGASVAELLTEKPAARVACSVVVPPGGAGPDVPPGIATWKVKIGEPDRLDGDLAALRRAPPGVRLRLDVNRRWSGAEAAAYLPRLAALSPEWVEEPTSAAALLALADRAALPPVPLALDESAVDDPAATIEAIERGLVRVLVLKPAVLGGLAAVAAWAARARRTGAVPVVSHLFDGPIAFAACAELALALARPGDPAAGLGPHGGLAALPGMRAPQLAGDHLAPHRPGLGVALGAGLGVLGVPGGAGR
jgi:L-Ala-D/L-Glu epimerase